MLQACERIVERSNGGYGGLISGQLLACSGWSCGCRDLQGRARVSPPRTRFEGTAATAQQPLVGWVACTHPCPRSRAGDEDVTARVLGWHPLRARYATATSLQGLVPCSTILLLTFSFPVGLVSQDHTHQDPRLFSGPAICPCLGSHRRPCPRHDGRLLTTSLGSLSPGDLRRLLLVRH